MNKEHHIEQLETRITICKNGGKWEVRDTLIDPHVWTAFDGYESLSPFPFPRYEVREIPWTLGREVNGHVLGEGQEWHRASEWRKDWLPEGTRPALVTEMDLTTKAEWEWKDFSESVWNKDTWMPCDDGLYRTSRPIPPADPYAEYRAAHARGEVIQENSNYANGAEWRDLAVPRWNLSPDRYRIKPAPVMVPLGPQDVPPGSAFQWPHCNWVTIAFVCDAYIRLCNGAQIGWPTAMTAGGKIQRPGEPWAKCEKPSEKEGKA